MIGPSSCNLAAILAAAVAGLAALVPLPAQQVGQITRTDVPAQVAQPRIGQPAPPLAFASWIHGPAPDLRAALGKKVIVLAVETPRNTAQWRGGLRILTRVAKRFEEAVVLVGVTTRRRDEATALIDELGEPLRIPLALDRDRHVTDALLEPGPATPGGQPPLAPCFVLDKRGRLAWHGPIDSDLDDVLDELVHDHFDVRFAAMARRLEPFFAIPRRTATQDIKVAAPLIEQFADRALGWTHVFEAWHGLAKDPGRASEVALQALRALGGRPREVGAFLTDTGIAAGALGKEFQAELSRPLGEAYGRAPRHRKVLEAYFEVLAATDDKDATKVAARWIERLKHDAPRLTHAADRLSTFGERYAPFALLAIDLARHDRPDDAVLLEKRFWILVRCSRDPAGASESGKRLVAQHATDATWLNSFAWDLLTEPETKGHFRELALVAAEAMTEVSGWEKYWRQDTVALALFENGLLEEAVAMQDRAYRSSTASSKRHYLQRLEGYRKALAAARDK